MPNEIVTIPCLADNYAFLIGNSETGTALLVDVPEAAPIQAELDQRGWSLSHVLLTHHHWDHVDGLEDLNLPAKTQMIGAAVDAHRLPALDQEVAEGDTLTLDGLEIHVFDVSGHTLGHIAFHIPQIKALFTADSLMALGCGRLFEGSPAQMFASLCKFDEMPDDTMVYSGHEYTATNARFALTIEPGNLALKARADATESARQAGEPTVPSELGLERATNPFLRAHVPEIAAHLSMTGAAPADVFAQIRKLRDGFS